MMKFINANIKESKSSMIATRTLNKVNKLYSYGLLIPGYLLVKYGLNVRPQKEIARGRLLRRGLGYAIDAYRNFDNH